MSKGKAEKRKSASVGLVSLVCLLLFLLGLTACSAGKSEDLSGAEAPQAASVANGLADANANAQAAPAEQDSAKKSLQNSTSVQATAKDQISVESIQAGGSGGIGPIADPDTGTNRKVIYKANVTMKVPQYDTAEEKLRDAIHLSGSYILQFNNSMDASGKGASYVIKVPADGFSSFIDRLREIQKDMQLQMEGSDVTEEYVDLNARLQAKKTVEARLLSFMDKSTKTDDLVRFSNELASVQEQIEQIKGRMRYLDQNVSYSTVNVRLYEGVANVKAEEETKAGFGQRMTDAITGSAKVLGQFGQVLLIFVAALLPVAAVLAVIGVPAYFIVRGRRQARKESAAQKRKEWNGRESDSTPADETDNPE